MKKLAHQRPARPRYEDAPAVDLNVLAGKPSVNFTHDASGVRITEPARERIEKARSDNHGLGTPLRRWHA